MAVKNWTCRDLINTVKRRYTGSAVNPYSDAAILEELNYAWQDICREGNKVLSSGWPFLFARTTITVTVASSPAAIPITGVSLHRLLAVRMADKNTGPKSLSPVSSLSALQQLYDLGQVGSPERYFIDDYNPVTNTFSIYIHPYPSSTQTATIQLTFVYQKSADEIADSPASVDNVEIPAEFREVLVLGALYRMYENSDRTRKKDSAMQEYHKALTQLKIHAHTMKEYDDQVTVESEERIRAGRQGLPNFPWVRRWG